MTPDYLTQEQTNPDQINPDQINPDQINPDQINPDQINPDQINQDHYAAKYTDPELRRRIMAQILQSDKGGSPGQWSARKSELLVREYEKQGGGYKPSHRNGTVRSMATWTEQDWQSPTDRDPSQSGNLRVGCLPQQVWQMLSDAKRQTAELSKDEDMPEHEQEYKHEHVHEYKNEHAHEIRVNQLEDKSVTDLQQQSFDDPQHNESQQSNPQEPDHRKHKQERSKHELYAQAKELKITGRSKMTKEELLAAIYQKQAALEAINDLDR